MIFFYGTGSSNLGTYPLRGIRCVNCGTPDSVAAVVISRYLQFFWIPVFPIGKRAVTVCSFCKQALEQYQLPPVYQQPVAAAKEQVRPPLTNYIGLALVGVPFLFLMVVGMFFTAKDAITGTKRPATAVAGASRNDAGRSDADRDDASHNAELLANPQLNDLYVVRYDDGSRMAMRVTRISPDTLYMHGSTFRLPNAAAAPALRDSLRKHEMPDQMPMQRYILQKMNEYGNLAIVRN